MCIEESCRAGLTFNNPDCSVSSHWREQRCLRQAWIMFQILTISPRTWRARPRSFKLSSKKLQKKVSENTGLGVKRCVIWALWFLQAALVSLNSLGAILYKTYPGLSVSYLFRCVVFWVFRIFNMQLLPLVPWMDWLHTAAALRHTECSVNLYTVEDSYGVSAFCWGNMDSPVSFQFNLFSLTVVRNHKIKFALRHC